MTAGPLAPSALDPDQRALAEVARGWLAERSPSSVVRAQLEAPFDATDLPPFWSDLVALGWVGLAVPVEQGGQGAALSGLAVVLEEWGRSVAPGPFPATALVATVLGQCAPHLLAPILEGDPAAVWDGSTTPVDGATEAKWILAPDPSQRGDGRTATRWTLVEAHTLTITPLKSADPTRRRARVADESAAAGESFVVPAAQVDFLRALCTCAESIGVASWCVHTAAQWARTREQFDRPIGQFQAVKHRCADALCRLELARAAAWDAASLTCDDPEFPLAVASAASLSSAAAFECAKDTIQVLGGIGYTWEHDAHLYLRRATVLHHCERAPSWWRAALLDAARAGLQRAVGCELPEAAEPLRDTIRAQVEAIAALPKAEWNGVLADDGWMQPHWPRPWGRDAGPLEQIVIDQELAAAHITRRHLQVAGWVLPTLIAHGNIEQQRRWIGASLRGEVAWCQLFSEPGAGSDLAALSTRAEKVDGGWSITGQKVWTTMAREADFGLCLARTDPGAPKHDGISCFVIDMASTGIDIRPLRELTGFAMFNEVFFDEVFVPADHLVGTENDGWRCARTTLENERVSMASGASFGPGVRALLALADDRDALADPVLADRIASLLVDSQALAVLGNRCTLRALGAGTGTVSGTEPGPEASVRKLVAVEHEQAVQETAMAVLGPDAVVEEGDGQRWFSGFLGNRALSIAGGTSEIQRNVIAERLLDLPRD